jgi:DNA-binding transcriptional LysR family regulator
VAEERRGLVVLSSVMSVAGAFLPRLIAAYRADRPGVEIHVRESVHGSVMEMCAAASPISGWAMSTELPDFAVGTPLGRETVLCRDLGPPQAREPPQARPGRSRRPADRGAADRFAHPAHHRCGGGDGRRAAAPRW